MDKSTLRDKIYKILYEQHMTEEKLNTILFKWDLYQEQVECILKIFDRIRSISVSNNASLLLKNPEMKKISDSNHLKNKRYIYIKPPKSRIMIDIGVEDSSDSPSLSPSFNDFPKMVSQYWMTDKKPNKEGYTNMIEFYNSHKLIDEIHLKEMDWKLLKPFLIRLTEHTRNEMRKESMVEWFLYYPGRLSARDKRRIEEIVDGEP
jgi:hypothetical protein